MAVFKIYKHHRKPSGFFDPTFNKNMVTYVNFNFKILISYAVWHPADVVWHLHSKIKTHDLPLAVHKNNVKLDAAEDSLKSIKSIKSIKSGSCAMLSGGRPGSPPSSRLSSHWLANGGSSRGWSVR